MLSRQGVRGLNSSPEGPVLMKLWPRDRVLTSLILGNLESIGQATDVDRTVNSIMRVLLLIAEGIPSLFGYPILMNSFCLIAK